MCPGQGSLGGPHVCLARPLQSYRRLVLALRGRSSLAQGHGTRQSRLAFVEAGLGDNAGRAFIKGTGCLQCHNSGYVGRIGLYEVMEVTDPIRRLIHGAAPTHELRPKLREQGFRSMREEGAQVALSGRTNVEEVLMATHQEDDVELQERKVAA